MKNWLMAFACGCGAVLVFGGLFVGVGFYPITVVAILGISAFAFVAWAIRQLLD